MSDPSQTKEARIALGRRLAQFRKSAGLTQQELAARISYGRSSVASAETALQVSPLVFWKRCDDELAAGGALVRQYQRIEIARREQLRAATVAESHRADAERLRSRRSEPVDPGLAAHWSGMLDVLAAAHHSLGPTQLHDVASGELELIHAKRLDAVGDVHSNLLNVEARWTEFVSWTAINYGSTSEATRRLRSALSMARQAEQPALVAYILMRQAQHTADQRDPDRTTALADRAAQQDGLSLRDRALCAIRAGQGYALGGDRASCRAALHLAYRLVAAADAGNSDGELTIGRHCSAAYVAAHEGYCHLHLGRPTDAISILQDVLEQWPGTYRLDEALTRTWLATAYVGGGRIEEGAEEGLRALDLAAQSGSRRILRLLNGLDHTLAPHHRTVALAFHTRLSSERGEAGTLG